MSDTRNVLIEDVVVRAPSSGHHGISSAITAAAFFTHRVYILAASHGLVHIHRHVSAPCFDALCDLARKYPCEFIDLLDARCRSAQERR